MFNDKLVQTMQKTVLVPLLCSASTVVDVLVIKQRQVGGLPRIFYGGYGGDDMAVWIGVEGLFRRY